MCALTVAVVATAALPPAGSSPAGAAAASRPDTFVATSDPTQDYYSTDAEVDDFWYDQYAAADLITVAGSTRGRRDRLRLSVHTEGIGGPGMSWTVLTRFSVLDHRHRIVRRNGKRERIVVATRRVALRSVHRRDAGADEVAESFVLQRRQHGRWRTLDCPRAHPVVKLFSDGYWSDAVVPRRCLGLPDPDVVRARFAAAARVPGVGTLRDDARLDRLGF